MFELIAETGKGGAAEGLISWQMLAMLLGGRGETVHGLLGEWPRAELRSNG